MKLSRRTVLEGLGGAAVTAFASATALASMAAAPDLEALFGPRRIEVVKEVWRAGAAGALEAAGPLDLGWRFVSLDELLGADDRFRVCRATRQGLALFMSGTPAVEIEVDPDENGKTWLVNAYTGGLAARFGLLPPGMRVELLFGPERRYRRRLWTGDAGEALGWDDVSDGKGWGRPCPELIGLV